MSRTLSPNQMVQVNRQNRNNSAEFLTTPHWMPLNADVECTDGRAGKLSHVILDPDGLKITHIVAKEKDDRVARDRPIPVESVTQ